MSMTKKSKVTKAVLASLVATSAIVPAIAVNAEVGGEVTRTVETTSAAVTKTIDFKVEDTTGHLGNYIKGPGNLVEMQGKQYIEIITTDAVFAMITSATVDGNSIIIEHSGKKHIYVPVTKDFAPVKIELAVNLMGNAVKSTATLTPDAKSIKEVTTETEKPTEEKIFKDGKTFESVKDGEYAIKWDAYNEKVGNYTAITSHFSPDAKLIVKEGKYAVQLTATEKAKAMLAGLKIAGKEATEKDGVYTVEIASISDLQAASVHVVVAAANMDKWYDFGFAIETANLDLPKAEAKPTEPTATKMPVTAYKEGTQELSIMHNKYLDDEVTVTATEGGYNVDVTFPEGQHLLGFKVEGATVALKSEEKVGNNTVKIYTVAVKDIKKLYTAEADLKVVLNGAVLYETTHKFQMQFGDQKPATMPFTDIANDIHKDYIVNLYEKGIFKAADKFNPKDSIKRYQFALMLNRALNLEVPATTQFTDIAKLDKETQDAIKALNAYGIINGSSATTFSAGEGIKRQHAALMIYRVLEKNGYQATGATSNFTDLPKDAEVVKAINELNHLDIMTGYNGKVTPNIVLTRSQMAKIVNNTLEVIAGLK